MKIVIVNNKGGQGKTLLAVLLIQYLIQKDKTITACDLDRTQLNLTDYLQENLDTIEIFSRFNDIPNDSLCVVDTPPHLDNTLMDIIKCADRLIVPVILGKNAVQGVKRIVELRDKQDIKFVINAYDDSIIQKQAKEYLTEQGFKFVGVIPRYKRLAYNIDCGLPWFAGFLPTHVKRIENILDNLIKHGFSRRKEA